MPHMIFLDESAELLFWRQIVGTTPHNTPSFNHTKKLLWDFYKSLSCMMWHVQAPKFQPTPTRPAFQTIISNIVHIAS